MEKAQGNDIVLDWKAPSLKKMTDYVKTLSDSQKKDYATTCAVTKEDGTTVIDKTLAKKWIKANCPEIKWKNEPKNERPMSSVDLILSWLNL